MNTPLPDEAEALAPVQLLLARIFLKEADSNLMRDLARPDIADVIDVLEPGFRSHVGASWNTDALDQLAAEFARLFLLPKGVSPYAASWIEGDEGTVRAHLEQEIATLYDALEIRPIDFGLGNVPSDHIGMLLTLCAVARTTETDEDLAPRCDALLEPWGPHFAAGILASSDEPLYRGAAALLLETLGLGPDA